MGLFLIILVVICLCWPWISRLLSRWFSGFMARRAEDMMRRMMGMPSRKEERRANRAAGQSRDSSGASERRESNRRASGGRYHRKPRTDAAALLKSVAVDVEYTEIKEFESTTIVEDDGKTRRVYNEEQVSDVEFMEIRER